MIPRDFHFSAFNNVWHLLWLLPLMVLVFYSFLNKKKKMGELVEENLQNKVIIPRDPIFTGFKFLCFVLGWTFAVIALMDPLGNEYYKGNAQALQNRPPSLDLIFLMDVSTSMAVTDMRNKMTRLSEAEEIADRLVSKLKSDSVALFAFSSQLVSLVPMTLDRTFFRLMLREIQFNEEDHFGTDYATVFMQLQKHIVENYPKSSKAIILFSDGGDTNLESLTGGDKVAATEGIVKEASRLNVPIFTVGMGSSAGGEVPDVLQNGNKVISKLDETLLLKISEKTGGRYFTAIDQSPIDLASKINQSLGRPRNTMEVNSVSDTGGSFHYYFQIPLALSLVFFALYYLFPSVRHMFFLLPLIISFQAHAQDVGKILFDSGQYAESSEWYAGELKHLPPEWLRNKLLYNLGTSLMAEKKWDDAKRAFFAVSDEGYTYPLFRLRLIYNQLLILWHEAKKDPHAREKLQDALFILDLVDNEKCDADCPEHVLEEYKKKVEERLSRLSDKETIEASPYLQVSRLTHIFRLASVLPKLSDPSLKKLEQLSLQSSNSAFKEAVKQSNLKLATFLLEQEKEQLSSSPTELLESLLDEIPLASAVKGKETVLLDSGRKFYPFVFEWQKKQFATGACQCSPWGEVIPPFSEGLKALEVEPFDGQLFYTYDKWLDALKQLQSNKDSSSSSQQQDRENEDLRELQEMQTLDKQKNKAKMQSIGEGMPW